MVMRKEDGVMYLQSRTHSKDFYPPPNKYIEQFVFMMFVCTLILTPPQQIVYQYFFILSLHGKIEKKLISNYMVHE